MLTADTIVGRYLFAARPTEAHDIVNQFRPKAKHPKYVQLIYNEVNALFSELSTPEELRAIFVGSAYQLYQPLSFLSKITDEGERSCGKLPQGVRDEMARLLGYENSEMCNYIKDQVSAFMKPQPKGTPERPFRKKVMMVVDRFLPYSINPEDTQIKMF